MPNTTYDDAYGTRPNPLGQSFWLVIVMGFAVLMIIGKLGPAVDGATPRFEAADLLELADAGERDRAEAAATTPTADPPALIEAPRLARPDIGGDGDGRGDRGRGTDAAGDGVAGELLAGPIVAAGAAAETDGDDSSPMSEQTITARGSAALATISYPWQQLLPEWTIDFLPEKSGLYGLTLVPERRIEIYVRDGQTEELLAHVIAHELGHAIDVTLNDGPDRRVWEETRGIGGEPWWPGNGTSDFSTGAGDFAESFAAWQVGSGSFRSTLGDPPTQEQIELLAGLAAG